MKDAVLDVSFAGPHVSIQDGGRPGLMRYGVPASGPLDRTAFTAANIALGNPPDAPAIEVSAGGLVLKCVAGAMSVAVAGGGFAVDVAGQKRESWTIVALEQGQTLSIRPGSWGSWCYLAFAGRLKAEHWLGSAATHVMSGFGGGRLTAGRQLEVADPQVRADREGDIACPDFARPCREVRVTMGPQDRFFDAAAIGAFLSGEWRMSDAWDRMGVRLAGPGIAPVASLDMPSEPISRGSVQVAGDGVATVLLADHQTTGGYPKIATLLDCDLDGFVQLRPRDVVRFRPVDAEAAVAAHRAAADVAARYREEIMKPRGSLLQRLLSENLISGIGEVDPIDRDMAADGG